MVGADDRFVRHLTPRVRSADFKHVPLSTPAVGQLADIDTSLVTDASYDDFMQTAGSANIHSVLVRESLVGVMKDLPNPNVHRKILGIY